jgi:hypothetical protein
VVLILPMSLIFFMFLLFAWVCIMLVLFDVGGSFGEAVCVGRFDGGCGGVLVDVWTEGVGGYFFWFGDAFVHNLTILH